MRKMEIKIIDYSEYVVNALSTIKEFDSARHYQAAIQLKNLAIAAENERDATILEVISGALSMAYDCEKQKFTPKIVLYDGNRSFSMDDIKPDDVDLLKKIVDVFQVPWACAQLSHIVWIITKDFQYGQKAVQNYLYLFNEVFDSVNWVQCYNAAQTAYNISILMGKNSLPFRQTRSKITEKIIFLDGKDSLFLSLQLLSLVISDASKDELNNYLEIVTRLVDKNINPQNSNVILADETYKIQEQILKRLKLEERIIAVKKVYAHYYEEKANEYEKKEEYFRAIDFLKKACQIYKNCDTKKLQELRLKLEKLQINAMNDMPVFQQKFEIQELYDEINETFEELSIQEKIVQIGRWARFYEIDEVKQQLDEKKNTYFFSSLFKSGVLNAKGQMVHELPPLSEIEDNPDLLYKHMVHHVSEERGLFDSMFFSIAYNLIWDTNTIEINDLDFLVYDNAIVPDGREEILKEGLYLALTGKLYSAMHILLPQTENIFRNLVKMCGDTVTFLKEDGTEEYKPLSCLFESEKLQECFSENIIFTFQSMMVESIGENYRNLIAHGILESEDGNSSRTLCFVSLLIKLLMMYGKNAWPIMKKLAERQTLRE